MNHRDSVIEKMSSIGESGVSVEDAYRLSSYDNLMKLANEGRKAMNDLAAMKTKIEQGKKKDLAAPKGGTGEISEDSLKHLSAAQRAMMKAKERTAKAAH